MVAEHVFPPKYFFPPRFSLYKASSTQTHKPRPKLFSAILGGIQAHLPQLGGGISKLEIFHHHVAGHCDSLKGNPAARGIICIPNPNILCRTLHQKPTAFGKVHSLNKKLGVSSLFLSSLHLLCTVEGNPRCSFSPQNGNLPPNPIQ